MTHQSNKYFGLKLILLFAIILVSSKFISANEIDDPMDYDYMYNNDADAPLIQDQDTGTTPKSELKFPIPQNNSLDDLGSPYGPLHLNDPSNIQKDIEYNAAEDRYYFTEKVGGQDIKPPTYMSAEEYQKYKAEQDERLYFQQRLEALSLFNQKPNLPTMYKEGLFNRLFGSNKLSVKPNGRLELSIGYNHQNIKNPSLQERQRKYGNFDFDMNMDINLLAQVGDKLKLNINNNTQPVFGEQQTQKIEFTGKEDEILKKIEAGNVSFPLNSSLISGVQSLYGLKGQLQFGKLWLTGVISNQRSQRKSLTIQGGGQVQNFEIKADDYDENRNFLLGQYFYENYERALVNFPVINSQALINRVEVWITNRQGSTQSVRDVLAFMDLGESNPYQSFLANGGNTLPDNASNRLYSLLLQNQGARTQSTASQTVLGLGLVESQDFHRSTMRQLSPSEFTFQPQLGYISLNTSVNPDDIVAVSYRYTYNGKVYQVGEFASDVSPDSSTQKVMYMKMMKGTAARPTLPIWNLMMKNVYSLGYGRMSNEDFKLNVMYLDPGGGLKRYLPDGPNAGVPIIKLLNLDRLNKQNDPIPDGVFDYVEGITIVPTAGKVIFPVLKPFSNGLKPSLDGNLQLERRYLYPMLYDSTKTIARQFQQNNRFVIKGSYKGEGGSDISLGFNIPQGSVSVTAGGQRLTENVDYQIDYSLGRLKILNAGILSSGVPINVSYEDNANFNFVQQSFWGLRADYFFNKKVTLGGTLMRLSERPLTTTVPYGDDPIKNTVAGLDFNYQSEAMALTRVLDKLPFYSTTAPSLISFNAEVAGIFPGHHKYVDVLDPEGSVALDNFEGANSSIDLRYPISSWSLASVPVGAKNAAGSVLFPEATNINNLNVNDSRAKIAWYNIDQGLLDRTTAPDNLKTDTVNEPYWRVIKINEVFPDKPTLSQTSNLNTFDISYFPSKRGPYNFTFDNINPNSGEFLNPQDKFGGIMRALDNNSSDFEQSNVEFITFWALDPFIGKANSTGGDLYLNLGNVSEDVLKDARLCFENGTPYPKDLTKMESTIWGYVPSFAQQITRVFEADAASRAVQDVGFDALDDGEERIKHQAFLSRMEGILGAGSEAYQALLNDPSSDNFKPYRSADHDNARNGIIQRYQSINGPDGNSPVAEGPNALASITSIPESEDLNKDNTLNESESYFQYRVRLMPKDHPMMQVGQNNIVNRRETEVELSNGTKQMHTWYQFKISIKAYDQAVGNISDFRSIRFARMFMSGFQDSLTLRFAELQLDRNQWRTYLYSLKNPGELIPNNQLLSTTFSITSVSVEQNSSKFPVGYKSPPGVSRQRVATGATGQVMPEDERSLAIQVCGLKDDDARAAFKEVSVDMRQFKKLRMFIHAESVPDRPAVRDGDLYGFIRIGSDFVNNYYEYRIPLQITSQGENNADFIWPERNRMDITLEKLVALKNNRNNTNIQSFYPYEEIDDLGNTMIIIGNPNLGEVRNVMLGVRNPKKTDLTPNDDGLEKCAEVWFDELRLVDMNEEPGYAATMQANIQLADLGSVHVGASMHTIGYGNIDQKVNSRFRDDLMTYDINTNLNLGKLMPSKWNVQLPVYAAYTESSSKPEYDPYDLDVKLKDKLETYSGNEREEKRKAAETFTSITSLNFSNIRILGNPEKQQKSYPWQLKNFDLNYSYNKVFNRNPLVESDELTTQKMGLGYNYETRSKSYEPFKKMIKSKSKWLLFVKDFNINPLPKTIGFNTNMHKIFGETIVRNIDNDPYFIEPTYYQNFVWERRYNFRWELMKSLSFSYDGMNQSRIDEPYGRMDTQEKRDSMWSSIGRFGRNTYYSQSINATYKLPTNKFRFSDWTTITLNYASTYNWQAAPLVAAVQGNIISNTQTKSLNSEFTFSQLYMRNRYLKAAQATNNINQIKSNINVKNKDQKKDELEKPVVKKTPPKPTLPPRPERKKVKIEDIKGRDTLSAEQVKEQFASLKKSTRKKYRVDIAAWRKKRNAIAPEMTEGSKAAIRFATMLKRVSFNYNETAGTVLPGFMDTAKFMGSSFGSRRSWYDFALGGQPTQQWIEYAAVNGQMTRDSIFNNQIRQQYSQNINISGMLEPFSGMRIDVTMMRNFNKQYSETYKYNETAGEFEHLSPYTTGSFSTSFIGLKSFFGNSKANYSTFLSNRTIISERLGNNNPYVNGALDPSSPNYRKGYTQFSQEVLIPSFIAAYGGRKAQNVHLMEDGNESVKSNPFRNFLPMPNWRITYNGLTRWKAFEGKVKNITLTSGYSGSMNLNSFTSNLTYQDLLGVGFPSFIDSTSNNFVPFYQVPNVTITETFSPLTKVQIALENGMSFDFAFNKSRMMSLSLVDYQISETKSSDFVFGFGHRLKGLELPFSFFGITRLENDLNIRVDVSYRNDVTTNTYFSNDIEVITRGQKLIKIAPRIDYMVNDNLQLVGFYERTQTIPYVLTSYPLTNTKFGFKLIYLFSPQ